MSIQNNNALVSAFAQGLATLKGRDPGQPAHHGADAEQVLIALREICISWPFNAEPPQLAGKSEKLIAALGQYVSNATIAVDLNPIVALMRYHRLFGGDMSRIRACVTALHKIPAMRRPLPEAWLARELAERFRNSPSCEASDTERDAWCADLRGWFALLVNDPADADTFPDWRRVVGKPRRGTSLWLETLLSLDDICDDTTQAGEAFARCASLAGWPIRLFPQLVRALYQAGRGDLACALGTAAPTWAIANLEIFSNLPDDDPAEGAFHI